MNFVLSKELFLNIALRNTVQSQHQKDFFIPLNGNSWGSNSCFCNSVADVFRNSYSHLGYYLQILKGMRNLRKNCNRLDNYISITPINSLNEFLTVNKQGGLLC